MQRRGIKLKVYAKVNLSLNISGVRGGMHELDMVITSADFADVITVFERSDGIVNVVYDSGAALEGDTAAKAAKVMRGFCDIPGADIYIEKGIPFSAGLGGSSADAAGVIIALDKMFGLSEKGLKTEAAALQAGSDVPYMLKGGFARVESTGGRVTYFDVDTPLNLVICKGARGVSTGLSYAEFDKIYKDKRYMPSDNHMLIRALKRGDIKTAAIEMHNALQQGSCLLEPQIVSTLNSLKATSPAGFLMSGSGSACVGVYESFEKAKEAEKLLLADGLTAKACKSLNRGVEIL